VAFMRKLLCLAALALVFAACDPTIQKFEVTPAQLPCPGNVLVEWEGDADGGWLKADQPVTPPFPATVLKKGTLTEKVTQTTTFTFSYPSAAHREKTVTVANMNCGGGGSGCGPKTVLLTGICTSASMGPSYTIANVSANGAPGNLTQLVSNADFPVHVLHAGQEIALGANGAPIFPLPVVPAAGDYTITVPGQVGLTICKDAGPTSGTTDAPPVQLTITPTCPP
jgi:hypothetical protein